MITLPVYNQGDVQWRDKLLGTSGRKMWSDGCYVTTTASILASHMVMVNGHFITPGELCEKLNAAPNGFDPDGQLGWDAIYKLFPTCKMVKSCWTTNVAFQNISKTQVSKAIDDIKQAVRMGFPIGICVDLVGSDKFPDHIVACKDAPDDLNEWKIMDPDGGRDIKFKDRYGSPLTGVMGYRLLVGPPVMFPDYATPSDQRAGQGAAQCIDARYSKADILTQLIGS